MKTTAALALLLLLTGCAAAPAARPEPTPPSADASGAVVELGTRLVNVKVRRTPTGLHVAAWWRTGDEEGGAITESDDDFATSRVRPWTDDWYTATGRELEVPGLEGLMQQETTSLAPGVRAVSGGSDGATLFPFEAMARSTDGGATWTTYDVTKVDGERAYSSGDVVLPDGRVLALLTTWSDDRRGRPSDRHHGLFVSAGDDWSHYSPVTPTFSPEPRPTLHGWPNTQSLQASPEHGGVVWITAGDQRVYASTDGARTFGEIRVR